jgi:hypothetical protein
VKCLVPARAFRKRLAAVAAVVPRQSPKPILQTVRLEVDAQGKGTLVATDLETWVRVGLPALRATRTGSYNSPRAPWQRSSTSPGPARWSSTPTLTPSCSSAGRPSCRADSSRPAPCPARRSRPTVRRSSLPARNLRHPVTTLLSEPTSPG